MRKLFSSILIVACSAFIFSSCIYKANPHTGNLPPGQAKKVTGDKSAKAYAPGQKKKH